MAEQLSKGYRLPLIAALAGFFANLAQVALFRFFMGQFYGTEIHLGLFLSVWLAGIAIGGYCSGKFPLKLPTLLWTMAFLPFFTIFSLKYGGSLLPNPGGGFLPFGPVVIFMIACVIPVAFVIGMFIPCMVRLTGKSIGVYYSIEAVGSFIAGIFFSLLLGGTASSILSLMILPLPALVALLILGRQPVVTIAFTLLIAPMVWYAGPKSADELENAFWKKNHSTLKLQQTVETPYQKLQIGSYYELKSVFSNGMFSDSWPLAESAESRVHCFVSALKNARQILVIGAPTTDVIAEFLKYKNLELTIVESDSRLIELLEYPAEQRQAIHVVADDPRFFLNHSTASFDGIMINAISPVTLAGNRLFTVEALMAARSRLRQDGVLSLQVSGGENYMGSVKEQIIIGTWRALQSVFPCCFAFPGSNITFFASSDNQAIPRTAQEFASRFSERKIVTATFYPMSFHNILMPFRVNELNKWLAKDISTGLNTDEHPDSFAQQLQLWNIYSGASFNHYLNRLQKLTGTEVGIAFSLFTLAFLLLPAFLSNQKSAKFIIAAGVAISGATGLLCEIILILIYQNQFGAAYQMTAFFFGVYMLGLASGSMSSGRVFIREEALRRLKLVKIMQILFTGVCIAFVSLSQFHSAAIIGLMVFTIAFLDGIEFPVADSILRSGGRHAHDSAGLLLFADNAGALMAGLTSGLWLLPALGMRTSFALLLAALIANYVALLIFNRRLRDC